MDDQVEAMTLADRIVVLRGGVIEQIGTPAELYAAPQNRFVAGFIGSPTMNFLKARLSGEGGGMSVVLDGGVGLAVPPKLAGTFAPQAGRDVIFGIRPEHLTNTLTEHDRDAQAPISIKVEIAEPLGADTLVFTRIGDQEVVCRTTPETGAVPGATMALRANMNHMHLFDVDTGRALDRAKAA